MTNFRKRLYPAYKANREPLPSARVETRIYRTEEGWRAVAYEIKLDTKLVDIKVAATPTEAGGYLIIRALLTNALTALNAKEVRYFPPKPMPDHLT
jgi:hypothetical protein